MLRGPQAAAFGANALAGMVVVRTADPTPVAHARMTASVGTDDLFSFGAATSGPVSLWEKSPLSYRLSLSHYQDNGFRHNSFLGRDDTNARDESSARLKLAWQAADTFSLNLTLLLLDMDNGYDAWSLTNDSFNTSTDEPGEDDQQTLAAGLVATWQLDEDLDLAYRASFSDSDLLYGYDWDWSNTDELMQLYGPEIYEGSEIVERERRVHSHDLRLAAPVPDSTSLSWVTGLYFRDFDEDQEYFGTNSNYATRTTAVYGQVRLPLTEQFGLNLAARWERLEINYNDDTGSRLESSESPWGGKLALEYSLDSDHLLYASLDRGFKAGGINIDNEIPTPFRVYETETLLNYELGWKAFYPHRNLRVQLIAFYMDRQDIQVDSSVQTGDGGTFALYKDNAASGHNYGAEIEIDWQANQYLRFYASLGLLEAEFDEYRYVSPIDNASLIILDGTDQAYAPAFTYAAGAEFTADNGFFAGISVEGRDDYQVYGQTINGHALVHLRTGLRMGAWTFSCWVNNLFDEQYDSHAFYFANEPPLYDNPRKWVSQGAPRHAGVSVEWEY